MVVDCTQMQPPRCLGMNLLSLMHGGGDRFVYALDKFWSSGLVTCCDYNDRGSAQTEQI